MKDKTPSQVELDEIFHDLGNSLFLVKGNLALLTSDSSSEKLTTQVQHMRSAISKIEKTLESLKLSISQNEKRKERL